jgi:hypothetical protein
MPRLIAEPAVVTASGNKPKRIGEGCERSRHGG